MCIYSFWGVKSFCRAAPAVPETAVVSLAWRLEVSPPVAPVFTMTGAKLCWENEEKSKNISSSSGFDANIDTVLRKLGHVGCNGVPSLKSNGRKNSINFFGVAVASASYRILPPKVFSWSEELLLRLCWLSNCPTFRNSKVQHSLRCNNLYEPMVVKHWATSPTQSVLF